MCRRSHRAGLGLYCWSIPRSSARAPRDLGAEMVVNGKSCRSRPGAGEGEDRSRPEMPDSRPVVGEVPKVCAVHVKALNLAGRGLL